MLFTLVVLTVGVLLGSHYHEKVAVVTSAVKSVFSK